MRHQNGIGLPVALDVALQLRHPVVGVRFRNGRVLRASVPEAAVDEDCDPQPSEHDVGTSAHSGDRGMVNAISQTSRVQDLTKSER